MSIGAESSTAISPMLECTTATVLGSIIEFALTGDFFTGVSMSEISPKISLHNFRVCRSLIGVSGTISLETGSFSFDDNFRWLSSGFVDVDAANGNAVFAGVVSVVSLFAFAPHFFLEVAVLAPFCVFVHREPSFRIGSGSICLVIFTDGDRLDNALLLSSRISIKFSGEGTHVWVGGVISLLVSRFLLVSLAR